MLISSSQQEPTYLTYPQDTQFTISHHPPPTNNQHLSAIRGDQDPPSLLFGGAEGHLVIFMAGRCQ